MTSIRAKMLMWFGLTLGLFMAFFGVTIYTSIKDTVIPLTNELSQEILKGRSAEIGRLIKGYQNEVRSIATRDAIYSGDFEVIGKEILKLQASHNADFNVLFYSDVEGRFITSKGTTGNVSDRGYWKAIIKEGQNFAISDPLLSKDGERMFMVASVVTSGNGTRVGLAAASILLKTLSNIAETIKINGSGVGWIVDSTGLVVAHPDPALPMKLNLLHSSAMGYQGLEKIGQSIVKGESGQASFVRPDGTKLMAIFNPIPNTPGWAFVIALNEAELMSRSNSLIRLVAWLMSSMLAVVLLVVIILSRMITAPVLTLKEGVNIVSGGNLDHLLDIHTGDEIQELADAFNKMTFELKEHRNLLEQKVAERTQELQEKNNNIMESIDYAQRLQRSILPPLPHRLGISADKCFVIWKPKDVVGGDMYWCRGDDRFVLVAVVDCTGHGVPGALMTMAVGSILEGLPRFLEGQKPSVLLHRIHSSLKETLRQEQMDSLANDGADVALCLLDKQEKTFLFAGAKLSLFLEIEGQVFEYKGVKHSVGYSHRKDVVFEDRKIDWVDGSVVYLTTDGLLDQNGEEGKGGMGRTGFVKLLQSVAGTSFAEREHAFEQLIAEKMKNVVQRDDITIVAFEMGKNLEGKIGL